MRYRSEFLGFLERERTRAYYRAGWHSLSWRSFCRAVAAAPVSLLHGRSLRRCLTSLVLSGLRKDEGPVASPPSHGLLGHHRDFYANPIGFTRKASRLGTNVRLDLQRRSYLIHREQDIDHVLKHNAANYQPAGISVVAPAFARAVLGTPFPSHASVKSWLAPFFSTRSIAAWAPTVTSMFDRRMAALTAGTVADIAPLIRSANFEVASWIVLGCDSPDVMLKLDESMLKSHSYSTRILRSFIRTPDWVPLRAQRVIRKAERDIDQIFASLVSRDNANSPPSVLHQMLATRAHGGEHSLETIRHNLIGLMLASTEPAATTTTLALHVLGKDPALQQQLVDEITQTKEKSNHGQAEAFPRSLAELRELVQLNRFIDEIHRLYPAEWLLTRVAERTDRLPGGLLVRRGHQVMINLNDLQRSASRYSEPDRFDPDRFRRAPKPNGSYLPFGAGATACLGQPLARFLIATLLIAMLSKWRVESVEDEVALESPNCFSLSIMKPVAMRLQRRDGAGATASIGAR